MKHLSLLSSLGLGALSFLVSSCGGSHTPPTALAYTPSYSTHPQYFPTPTPAYQAPPVTQAVAIQRPPAQQSSYTVATQPARQIQRPQLPMRQQAGADSRKLASLYKSVNVSQRILPRSARSRTNRPMTPRYITIHSTQNTSEGADAWRHQLALSRGALGSKSWHFTTDEKHAVQHIPLNEQGNHAENYRGGPGNSYSIGIEMCENKGNSLNRTIDRTAKLTAYLMHKHNIPLANVKPHYHWPRRGVRTPNKNCPRFLLDNGRPGRKWQNYLNLVQSYYERSSKSESYVFLQD